MESSLGLIVRLYRMGLNTSALHILPQSFYATPYLPHQLIGVLLHNLISQGVFILDIVEMIRCFLAIQFVITLLPAHLKKRATRCTLNEHRGSVAWHLELPGLCDGGRLGTGYCWAGDRGKSVWETGAGTGG
jgi:hypothetical protein